MQVKENVRMTCSACEDIVVQLKLEPVPGEDVRPHRAGQFVRIGIPGVKVPAPDYFPIATSPCELDRYEFYIKDAGPLSKYLCDIEAGAELEVEGPMGKGFDIAAYNGFDVFLIGVGTGIAPLRSVWRYIIANRKNFGHVAIYAGFRSSMHCLLTDELDHLAEHNIEVSITLEMGHESWDGPIGYVQQALKNDAPDGSSAVACLAGMSAMVDACTETLQNLGFNDSRILLNR
jgi:NAD(P)H-flavin reductase